MEIFQNNNLTGDIKTKIFDKSCPAPSQKYIFMQNRYRKKLIWPANQKVGVGDLKIVMEDLKEGWEI